MSWWNKFSINAKYYALSFACMTFCWGLLSALGIDFANLIFFLTAFIWHFALLTPGLKEQVLTRHHKLSFLAIVVRTNHYMQMLINFKRLPYAPSFIRTISPTLFIFLLFILGGTGNILFALLGSLCFEVFFLLVKMKTGLLGVNNPLNLSGRINDPDIVPAIPSAEKSHE